MEWRSGGRRAVEPNRRTVSKRVETAAAKVRNVSPVKINEFQISAGAPANATNAFIELYNAGD